MTCVGVTMLVRVSDIQAATASRSIPQRPGRVAAAASERTRLYRTGLRAAPSLQSTP